MHDLIGLENVTETIFTSETVDNDTKIKWRMEVVALRPFCGFYLNILV